MINHAPRKRKYHSVVAQVGCDKEEAKEALRTFHGDIKKAVQSLLPENLPHNFKSKDNGFNLKRNPERDKECNMNLLNNFNSKNGDDDDDFMFLFNSKDDQKKKTLLPPRKRKKYTGQEDDILCDFVDVYSKWNTVSGNALWKYAEKCAILPERTWQSMKDRYLTYSINGGVKNGVQIHFPFQPDPSFVLGGNNNVQSYGPSDRSYYAFGCVVPATSPPNYRNILKQNSFSSRDRKRKRERKESERITAARVAVSKNKTKSTPKKISAGEKECKRALENIYKKPFLSNIRPDFMSNPIGGHNLELDVYNSDLKLACEYNGIQHYQFVPFFHSNKQEFDLQKYKDEIKRRLCKDNNIDLIEVPYTVEHDDIENYIRDALDAFKKMKEKQNRIRI
jgi:hypothetical protein